VRRDAEGFFLDPEQWTEEMAIYIARENGVPALTDLHWRAINLTREAYHERGSGLPSRALAMASGLAITELQKLFPRNPGTLAAKIAGIPRPGRF
jgi:tRNA 2-thiouridine synthesizing protein E